MPSDVSFHSGKHGAKPICRFFGVSFDLAYLYRMRLPCSERLRMSLQVMHVLADSHAIRRWRKPDLCYGHHMSLDSPWQSGGFQIIESRNRTIRTVVSDQYLHLVFRTSLISSLG